MKIGMAQIEIPWKSYEENQKKCRAFFEKARDAEVDILVFPEMTLTGFDVESRDLAGKEQETIVFFQQLTEEFQICAVYGYAGKGKEKNRNHLRMTDCGQCILEYEKIHPFTFGAEGKYFEGGDRVASCQFKKETFAGFICYDLRFPEIFLQASSQSNCIFVIANWPETRIAHWNALLKARAIENLCYVVGVNCTGQSGTLMYNGMSAVYGPDGRLIAGEQEGEAFVLAELDFDWLRKYQNLFPFKRDRRIEIYHKFYRNEDKREG